MTRQSLKAASAEIFEKLTHSQEYRNGFAKHKRRMITQLFAMKNELVQFAQTPGRRAYQINGFLMEHCARLSNQLPKNTPKAQYIAEVIISHLNDCELSNPDYIWLKLQGRRMTFAGIGEVKSHPFSVVHRPRQLFFQETNIRNLIRYGHIPPLISKRYHITLADTFMRYLILPRSIDMPHILPASAPLGWEIKEIEFTFPEIIFLKNVLCADASQSENLPQYGLPYSPEEYELFAYKITAQVEEIIADLFQNILHADKQDIRKTLAIWSMLYNSIPANRESIDLVMQWIHRVIPCDASDKSFVVAQPPCSLITCDGRIISSHPLMQYATNGNAELARALISRVQEIKQDFPNPPKLSCKQNINIFALL